MTHRVSAFIALILFAPAAACAAARDVAPAEVSKSSKAPRPSKAPSKPASKPAAKPAKLPARLQEIEKKYAEAATFTAKFVQIKEVAALKSIERSEGRIYLKRPDKVRWETHDPDANVLVSDGKVFWFYTPPFDEGERGQVIIRRATQVQTRFASSLLSGAFSRIEGTEIEAHGASRFTIVPAPGTAGDVLSAEVTVSPSKLIVTKVVLSHAGGNRSEIALSMVELGRKLGDEMFVFQAPPDTDVLRE